MSLENERLQNIEEDDFQVVEDTGEVDEEYFKLLNPEVVFSEMDYTILKFSQFPAPIKRKIIYQSALAGFINLIFLLIIIIFSFQIELLVVIAFVDLLLISNIHYLYNTLHNVNCRIFDGYVLNYEDKGVPGTSSRYKRVTICDEKSEKFIMFDYYGKGKMEKAYPVTLYLSKNAEVVMKDDMPYVKNILAVTFGVTKETESIGTEESMNIEEYLEK